LLKCAPDIGGVRVRHGLDDDGRAAADHHVANLDAMRFPPI
jgi:hypothetical protein